MRLYDACKSAYSNYKVAAGVLACMSYPLYVYMCVCVCVCVAVAGFGGNRQILKTSSELSQQFGCSAGGM